MTESNGTFAKLMEMSRSPLSEGPSKTEAKSGKEESRKVGKLESRKPRLSPLAKLNFQINAKPDHKDSFFFTDEEFESLDDMKRDLRRRYGLPATKESIARVAITHIFNDYVEQGEDSIVVREMKNRTD